MSEPLSVRWFWAVDADGRRITEAEAVAIRHCDNCQGFHPVLDLAVSSHRTMTSRTGQVIVTLRPLFPAVTAASVAGITASEFPPDEE